MASSVLSKICTRVPKPVVRTRGAAFVRAVRPRQLVFGGSQRVVMSVHEDAEHAAVDERGLGQVDHNP
jgi:hypothetical protein